MEGDDATEVASSLPDLDRADFYQGVPDAASSEEASYRRFGADVASYGP